MKSVCIILTSINDIMLNNDFACLFIETNCFLNIFLCLNYVFFSFDKRVHLPHPLTDLQKCMIEYKLDYHINGLCAHLHAS